MLGFLLILGIAALIIGGIMSIVIMRKQQNKIYNSDASEKVLNHPMRSNPIIILYWLAPFIMILGAVLLGLYYNWGRGY
ncbi:hypothetical protein CJP46_05055 [Paenibacillus sp. XY044]|nr:hypothetical protein CJP46_05055 [Paenibacillus sp. XY044]